MIFKTWIPFVDETKIWIFNSWSNTTTLIDSTKFKKQNQPNKYHWWVKNEKSNFLNPWQGAMDLTCIKNLFINFHKLNL